MEVTGIDKLTSLLLYRIIYDRKKFFKSQKKVKFTSSNISPKLSMSSMPSQRPPTAAAAVEQLFTFELSSSSCSVGKQLLN
jgi:hypothetical protein